MRARVVVLAASCCESARLLLNSKSSRFPNGLANSSGVVGKYLTDSTGLSVRGFIPTLMDLPRYNSDGVGGMHLYVPWWGDNKALGFPRGYHIELGGGFGMPGYGFGGGIQNYPQSRGGGYGADLKDEYRRYYGAFVGFAGRGEQVAREDCYCEIDPNVVDHWGIPVLRFHHTWSDSRTPAGASTCRRPSASIIQEMGGTPTSPMPTEEQDYGLAVGGLIIHEAGATRMGNDPKTSVLNANGQAHDVEERLRRRRRSVRLAGGQEPDVDDHGARVAHVRVHRGRAEEGEHLMRDVQATPRCLADPRRDAGRGRAAVHVDGARTARRAADAAAQAARAGAPPPRARPTSRGSSRRTSTRRSSLLADMILPKDAQSGSASEAGAPEFIDYIVAEQPDGQTRDARRPRVARRRVPAPLRQAVPRLRPTPSAARCSTTSPIRAQRRPRLQPRRPLLHDVARPGRRRVLVEQGRRRGPRLHGQPCPTQWDGAPQEVLDKLGLKYDA